MPQYVIVAVKTQVITKALTDYIWMGNSRTTFISLAAGTTIATLLGVLGEDTPVVRCMPNTPAAIGKGMIAVFANPLVTDRVRADIADMLSVSGTVVSIQSEELMGAVTAVSGSGPAYVCYFVEALAAAGQSVGLPAETAMLLARKTVYGAACLVEESVDHPSQLRDQVTSPNGTTQAGLDLLMSEDGLGALLSKTVSAACEREVELGKQSSF